MVITFFTHPNKFNARFIKVRQRCVHRTKTHKEVNAVNSMVNQTPRSSFASTQKIGLCDEGVRNEDVFVTWAHGLLFRELWCRGDRFTWGPQPRLCLSLYMRPHSKCQLWEHFPLLVDCTFNAKKVQIMLETLKENISTTVTNNLHAAKLPAGSSFVLKETSCVCAVGAYRKAGKQCWNNSGQFQIQREICCALWNREKTEIGWVIIYRDRQVNLPTWPDGKDDVALFCTSLHKRHAGKFLPVTHSLLKNGSLAAYGGLVWIIKDLDLLRPYENVLPN